MLVCMCKIFNERLRELFNVSFIMGQFGNFLIKFNIVNDNQCDFIDKVEYYLYSMFFDDDKVLIFGLSDS